MDDIPENSAVVIRSHGVTRMEMTAIQTLAKVVIDATCPFVAKVQKAAMQLSDSCDAVVVVGDAGHSEVKGIVSYIKGDVFIVSNSQEASELPYRKRYGVVAQTTQSEVIYSQVVKVLESKCKTLFTRMTICNATMMRQRAAYELAKTSDVMLVVGGINSANTARLCDICRQCCPRTFHVESAEAVSPHMLKNAERIGICSGASTPNASVFSIRDYILRKEYE
jgi:4-hydroxy-3-methylbut-2-enyl diphosphate reductase